MKMKPRVPISALSLCHWGLLIQHGTLAGDCIQLWLRKFWVLSFSMLMIRDTAQAGDQEDVHFFWLGKIVWMIFFHG